MVLPISDKEYIATLHDDIVAYEQKCEKLEYRLALAEQVVAAAKACEAGRVVDDGLNLPPAPSDWERLTAVIRAYDAALKAGKE